MEKRIIAFIFGLCIIIGASTAPVNQSMREYTCHNSPRISWYTLHGRSMHTNARTNFLSTTTQSASTNGFSSLTTKTVTMTVVATPSISLEAIATTSLSIPIPSPNDMPKEYSTIDIILFGIISITITIVMYIGGKDGIFKIVCCCSSSNDIGQVPEIISDGNNALDIIELYDV
ncbi:2115_t:CDS:2 [Paraglomus occultum]|uniref:2115_t:CDS:1 n=1 Tax=Paraglomus occultum TaxID=144539 RepID=A0A9N9CRR8_9GLOM|nr:2115_t:CDS:2 [Paraglomus occultum]